MAETPLHLLCIEPTFPGRLGAVADWLVRRRGYHCWFYCNSASPPQFWPDAVGKGLEVVEFKVGGVAREETVAWNRQLELGLCYAYGCWEVLDVRRPRPVDLVLGRSAGLGSTLFAPVNLPHAPVVNLFDYFFQPHKYDLTAEAGHELPAQYFHWRRSANAMTLLELENGITPWTPTYWQRDLFPAEYRAEFVVLYDGVDTRRIGRRVCRTRRLAGRSLAPETRVVTFIAQSLEQLRGFDRFMHLANRLVRARQDVICVIVGGSPVKRALDVRHFNRDYRTEVLRQSPPADPDRFWFLGQVPQSVLAEVLAVSDLHVYPSRSYAVARSLLEALAAGCVVLATDTEPAREVLLQEQTGFLVSEADEDAWYRRASAVLDDRASYRPIGEAAAELVRERFAQDVTLPVLAELFDRLVTSRD
jgi:glycosyltransferase involved in cell wall biosynthesis